MQQSKPGRRRAIRRWEAEQVKKNENVLTFESIEDPISMIDKNYDYHMDKYFVKNKDLICQGCGKEFKKQTALTRHRKSCDVHISTNEKPNR